MRWTLFALIITTSTCHAAEPIRALLVTGGCCHDYTTQKQILTTGLGNRIDVEWTIVEGGGDRVDTKDLYQSGWADGYDVIVHNECFGGVTDDAFIEGIVKAHREGTPGVFIHCSMHSYRAATTGTQAWRDLVGVTSVRHEKQKRPLTITPVDPHPILAAFPDTWQTPNGELYLIDEMGPNAVPLATTLSTETQREVPVIWTNRLGRTRVFAITLGHHNETMQTDVWLDTVARGLLWTLDALPENGSLPEQSTRP